MSNHFQCIGKIVKMEGNKMKIYREESLSGFEFWSGAKDFAEKLTDNGRDG